MLQSSKKFSNYNFREYFLRKYLSQPAFQLPPSSLLFSSPPADPARVL
jgi:hypothetical protein